MQNPLKPALHSGFLKAGLALCVLWLVMAVLCPLRAKAQEGPVSLTEYAAQAQGSVTVQILDGNGRETAVESLRPGQTYRFSLVLDFPYGMEEGAYFYDLPDNTVLLSDSPTGPIIQEDAEPIGSYAIAGHRILFQLDSAANYATDVWGRISAGLRLVENASGDTPIAASIQKTGTFDPASGLFSYTITATIPAGWQQTGEWYLTDHAEVGNDLYYPTFAGAQVLLDGVPLPAVSAAAPEDAYAYRLSTVGPFTRLTLVNRCSCTGESCLHWSEAGCRENQDGWCSCWRHSSNTTLTVGYSLPSTFCHSLLQNHPETLLYNIVWLSETLRAEAATPIPQLLEKSMTESANGQTRTYTLRINPERLDLSAQDPLVLRDTMRGMVWDGGLEVLCDGVAITQGFSADVSEDQKTLTLSLTNPGSHSYTVRYRTRLDNSGSFVQNVASLDHLYGGISRTLAGGSNQYFSENEWQYRQLRVTLHKSGEQGEALAGAVYGLYTAAGDLLTQRTSDAQGECQFYTSLTESMPLRTATPYYIQELHPPDDYALDPTRHWFYFSDSPLPSLDTKYSGIQRFAGSAGDLYATDQLLVWKLQLTKVAAADPAKPLEGAQFALFALDCTRTHTHDPSCYGTQVQSGITGADGVITLSIKKSVPYLLKETQAPPGYQCPGGGWYIEAKDAVSPGESPFEILAVDSPDGQKPPAFRLAGVKIESGGQIVTGLYTLYNVEELAMPFSGGGRWLVEALGAGGILLALVLLRWSLISCSLIKRKERER